MKRRLIGLLLALTLSLLVAPLAVDAQPRGKLPLLGVLEPSRPPPATPLSCSEHFEHRLRDLGYREGETIRLESRYAELQYDRLSTLAAELGRRQPDVIWTHSAVAARARKHATTTVSIVVGMSRDFVDEGLGESLARPGGNLTGLEMRQDEFAGKHLELLKAAAPLITRVAVLVDQHVASSYTRPLIALEQGAQALGLHLRAVVEVGDPASFAGAFAAMAEHRAEALVILNSLRLAAYNRRILELAVAHRLPTIPFQRTWAEAGSLLSYG
jgi:putative tryptophan/tyrosine transport system substrate-binding protein